NNCGTTDGKPNWDYSVNDPSLHNVACGSNPPRPCVQIFGIPSYSHWCSLPQNCPILYGTAPPGPPEWTSSDQQYNTLSEGRQVSCQYVVDEFTTVESIENWILQFGTTGINANSYNTIMTNFCSLPAPEDTCRNFGTLPGGSTACSG